MKSLGSYVASLGSPKALVEAVQLIPESDYTRAADFLRRMNLVLGQSYRPMFFESVSPDFLALLLSNPPTHNRLLEALQKYGLPASPAVLEAFGESGLESVIDDEISNIRSGNFNPNSGLHVGLEWGRYKKREGKLSLQQFSELPYAENQPVILTGLEERTSRDCAVECLRVYGLAEEMASREEPLLIAGNMRYGGNIVVKPMEQRLAELGAKVIYVRISSEAIDRREKGPEFYGGIYHFEGYRDLAESIARDSPNVLVVDGTGNFRNLADRTRMPAAMQGFVNFFDSVNNAAKGDLTMPYGLRFATYRIRPWAPDLTQKVYMGEWEFDPGRFSDGEREVVLASAVGGFNNSGARFDNAERYVQKQVECFGSRGYIERPIAHSEAEFVSAVQERISAEFETLLASRHLPKAGLTV